MLEEVLSSYGITTAIIQPYGSGLIHNTWKINDQSNDYILQRINHNVFKQPEDIAKNIEAIASWLRKNHPEYFFVIPVETENNGSLLHVPSEGYFRLFPFVKNSHTHDVAESAEQAFEAARQFGLFTCVLKDFPIEDLKITLPDFHNLSYRYIQFENAVQSGNSKRIKEAEKTIHYLHSLNDLFQLTSKSVPIKQQQYLVHIYERIIKEAGFPLRVIHHDTKISNVLFDDHHKGLCVIDLDTVMPGYFISDVGDMMRTYLSPVSEEEKDLSKIHIREDYFYGIAKGYLQEMGTELSYVEIQHFVYAGLFMIYMQALRFLTDYLNDDKYYGSSYPGHNYIRAKNQATLLQRVLEKRNELDKIVAGINPGI